MRTDNHEHKALFAIPSPAHGTDIATTKPLPTQRVITGHKQTDAYLWVLEVIQLNEPAHLPAAEEALKKLKITPQAAQQRYRDYLVKSGAGLFQVAFSTMMIDDPISYIHRAKERIEKASQVRSVFGTYAAALEDVVPEKIIKSSPNYVSDHWWGWNDEEREKQSIGHYRSMEIDAARRALVNGYRDVLPEPHTLSDVVREFQYWDWLYSMRYCASKEEGDEYGQEHIEAVYDREDYLEGLMATISPASRQEATDVCKWVLSNERLNDLGEKTDNIILNLVGECG